MYFTSTRGQVEKLTAAQAIARGIAPDGGLFVPAAIPSVDEQFIAGLSSLSYQERATTILQLFLTDYMKDELKSCVAGAYGNGKFSDPAVAPVVKIDKGVFVLELWHGPTSAFKDMALQLLPRLLTCALKKIGEQTEIVILVATSGDTGKAALEGFKDVEQTKVMVFYPEEGVSRIQRLQMVTQEGKNLKVFAVQGNFDDAQTGVKRIFNDSTFNSELAANGFKLSSANSINWGRLVPQIVYYFSAYADLVNSQQIAQGDNVNFVVPTGNFGNILAGFYAKQMGLPIKKLICASNSNNVLTDFLMTGVYNRNRRFYKTYSPSMDILISSNLERLLYHVTEQDAKQVGRWLEELNTTGEYKIGDNHLAALKEVFPAGWVDDAQTTVTIGRVFKKYGYALDPHTAVAWQVADAYRGQTGDTTPTIIVSTASPFKFNETVLSALAGAGSFAEQSGFAVLQQLSQLINKPVPPALAALEHKAIRHTMVCQKQDMPTVVKTTLQIK
ncbi:threonine synthase [Sporomusa acidovorans]|uniref:Threonine synthase n=1 Tax=Sporomusa acidovorans (strain ATCC 49682 / DSM 3132 / Mol) TaxID=1123286 RepID=A0ABZ3J5S3_SPOA4|nr:threonine synthase [Sporomusa acidovorans]OZC16407.1 threonine synthase [Sporomusa acidovorans DSM 3132]SDE99567.1 L-threonine synthase [Sporomusa acidovorans]